ncbi:MAG: M35 family metallo-endopeptidase [Candidatus Manganitrophus sp.]|nr:M35 family metallo-endopeptidase [Candidatus Manganitrophus sp.]
MGETTAMIHLSASAGGLIQRQPAGGAAAPPPLPACDISRCPPTHATTVPADIDRALGYVNQAITAVSAASLSDRTRRTVDWFFRGHSTATVNAIGTRLGCIRDALTDTKTTPRYACHPTYDALAYVGGVDVPICTDAQVPVCLTDQYFSKGDRKRAETMIHECAHRVGCRCVRASSCIYEWTARFRFMDTEEALRNADTFALFASSIVHGVPVSFLISAGAGGGAAWAGGERTWTATLHLDAELQHPIVSVFNPFLGLHFSALGMPRPRLGPPPRLIYSLVGGVRRRARAGASGAAYLSLFGGPSLVLGSGGIDIGAEAGAGLGYRWRWLDVSAGATVLHDPTREPDFRTWTNVGGVVRIALP